MTGISSYHFFLCPVLACLSFDLYHWTVLSTTTNTFYIDDIIYDLRGVTLTVNKITALDLFQTQAFRFLTQALSRFFAEMRSKNHFGIEPRTYLESRTTENKKPRTILGFLLCSWSRSQILASFSQQFLDSCFVLKAILGFLLRSLCAVLDSMSKHCLWSPINLVFW